MSRSKHQTLKSIGEGQSKRAVDAIFAEGDHDAMEWAAKRAIKEDTVRERRAAKHADEVERIEVRAHFRCPSDRAG